MKPLSGTFQTRTHRPRFINSAYTALYPFLYGNLHRGMSGLLDHYEELEHLSIADNRRRQWDCLLHLLQHAYDSTHFYRKRFDDAGVRPQDICLPSELVKIPPLTREDIRVHQDDLRSRRYSREALLMAATGGTTDTPVPVLRSPEAVRQRTAVHLRFNSWAGMWPGDKVLYLWGARSDFAQNPSWQWRLYDRYVMRRLWTPISLLNEQVLETYRQSLNQFRPRILYAYPTPFALFCEFLRDSGRPFHRPASAICTAEPLLAQQRRVIKEVLACPVFEFYGSREFGMIAAECGCHDGLHFNPFAAYVEFLPVEGGETEGLCEILVTDLLNDGMPLIRYKVNDCAIASEKTCPCGRGYPIVKQITGRTGDVFVLPNGDRVPGVALTNRVLQVCPGLRKLQVVQETLEDFRVRFVPGPQFSSADLDLLRANLKKFFPDHLRWEFQQVSDIGRERSGKTRFCISHVARPVAAIPGESKGRVS